MIKKIIVSAFCIPLLLFVACHKPKNVVYSYDPVGYYYQLLSFHTDSFTYQRGHIAWINASFRTQSDSTFWDTYNNLSDNFYIEIDSIQQDNFLKNYISKCSKMDSVCMLISTTDFFRQQFNTDQVPFFSKKDSVVKVNFIVKDIFSKDEFVKIKSNLQKREKEQIENYFNSSRALELAEDPLGFYWLERPSASEEPLIKSGDHIKLSYRGQFLNGRFLDKSPKNFDLIYGTPDQLIKGLNYVISRIKLGENTKIILPSRLAFGENGSSNGTVPPYTPLIYELKINDLKE